LIKKESINVMAWMGEINSQVEITSPEISTLGRNAREYLSRKKRNSLFPWAPPRNQDFKLF
jgi:hypothetical protein